MLMITPTMWMFHRILGHTTNFGPTIAFDGILVVGPSGLEQWLIRPTTAGHNANLRSHGTGHRLFAPRRESQSRGALVFIVRHHHGKGATAAGKGPAVAAVGFNVTDNGALRHGREGQDVADRETGFFAAVNELARVHAFGADE